MLESEGSAGDLDRPSDNSVNADHTNERSQFVRDLVPIDKYRSIFESIPGLNLILSPDFVMVAVTNSYLAATMTTREGIIGRKLFDVFPDNPGDPAASGTKNLRRSLETVLKTKKPHTMAVQRYDIRQPGEGEYRLDRKRDFRVRRPRAQA